MSTSTDTASLRGSEHPYYCSESNYYTNYQNDPGQQYDSWESFMSEFGDSDPDMNLVFRWDWKIPDPADYEGAEDEMPGEQVHIFFVLQRKGIFCCHQVNVTVADEPAIRAWLTERAKTIAAIWAPITLVEADNPT